MNVSLWVYASSHSIEAYITPSQSWLVGDLANCVMWVLLLLSSLHYYTASFKYVFSLSCGIGQLAIVHRVELSAFLHQWHYLLLLFYASLRFSPQTEELLLSIWSKPVGPSTPAKADYFYKPKVYYSILQLVIQLMQMDSSFSHTTGHGDSMPGSPWFT